MRITKILNRIYYLYLNYFYKTIEIDKSASIDFRTEIIEKTNIKIGAKSVLYKNITIYKNSKSFFSIGKHTHVAPYSYFLLQDKSIDIGDNVAIAKNCSFFCITNSIPDKSNILFKDSYSSGDIKIGNNVFIGTNCVVLPNTVIHDHVVIGANSTAKGELESGYLYGGNPIKKIRKLFI